MRFNGKKEGTLWYYRALSDEYQRRNRNRITHELALAVEELEGAAGVKPGGAPKKKRAGTSGR
jgi:hypothetical protein